MGAINSRKLMLGLVLLAVFLAITAAAFFTLEHYFFKRTGAIESAAGLLVEAETDTVDTTEETTKETGEFYKFDDIVINPLGGVRRSIVKIGLVGEFDPEYGGLVEELDLKMPRIRSSLLNYLSAVPVEVLADITIREALRDTLLLLINTELADGSLDELYIVDFIRQ